MNRKPIIVNVARVIIVLFIARCAFRIAVALFTGSHRLYYGAVAASYLWDVVLLIAAAACFVISSSRAWYAPIVAAMPVAIWLTLIVISPESRLFWLWVFTGHFSDPIGALQPAALAEYMRRYRTYEQRTGGVVSAFILEILLSVVLLLLLKLPAPRSGDGRDRSDAGPEVQH